MAERKTTSAIYSERYTIKKRIAQIVEVGRPILSTSNLVHGGSMIDQTDIVKLHEFYQAVAPGPDWPRTGSNWYKEFGPWEHLQLTAAGAEILTQILLEKHAIQRTNPLEMKSLGLLHDLGRLVLHDMYATDVVTEMLRCRLGIRQDLQDELPSIDFFYGRWHNPDRKTGGRVFVSEASQICPEHRIITLADAIGKKNKSTGQVQTLDQMIASVDTWAAGYLTRPLSGRATDSMFRLIGGKYKQAYKDLLISLKEWVNGYGIDANDISRLIEKTL